MRLTKFNPETGLYEYKESAKTQAEYNEQRKAVIQKLGAIEDNEREGEWIVHRWQARPGRAKGQVKNYSCSVCGQNNYRNKTKYCPNCGARMKGKEND